jgi:uncharacterized protein YlxP (DUF503 family)
VVIGVANVRLAMAEMSSLKDKRRVVKSVTSRVRAKYNVAIAEVGDLDSSSVATLGIACVSNEAAHAHAMLERVVAWIADARLDADLVDYDICMY